MTFFRQASATVRAGQGQAPSWIVPTLKGSTATVRPLQGLQFFVGSLTVGFTHGYSWSSPAGSTERPNVFGSHSSNQWLTLTSADPPVPVPAGSATCDFLEPRKTLKVVRINAGLECRCACVQKSERQATRRRVLLKPGRHREIPAVWQPTDLHAGRGRSTTQQGPEPLQRWASITLLEEALLHRPRARGVWFGWKARDGVSSPHWQSIECPQPAAGVEGRRQVDRGGTY